MKLELKRFDIKKIKDDTVVVLIGKRNTGKSFLIKDLLHYHENLPAGTVISATERANPFYSSIVPSIFLHDAFTPEIIEKVKLRQELILKQRHKDVSTYGKSAIDPRAFLILDDCLFDPKWAKDINIRYFFMNGRHIKLFFIITMQYPLGIPPNLRTNIDYVFILQENIVANRKRIYENFAGMFPSFEVFCQVMDQCTQNYECLVIDNTAKSNSIDDTIFWYKAEEHKPYQICSREYWAMAREHEKNKMEQEDDGEELYNPASFVKRNAPRINVKKTHRHT